MKQSGVRKIIFTVLVLTVIGIGLLHFFTPGHLGFYHDTYRRLSYLPIAVGSIMFGIRGGLILAFLTSLAFIPHILLYIGFGKDAYLSELTEILLYFTAAIVIGAIISKSYSSYNPQIGNRSHLDKSCHSHKSRSNVL